MVSAAGAWIIIAILIFVLIFGGLFYYYWEFLYEPTKQLNGNVSNVILPSGYPQNPNPRFTEASRPAS